MGSLRHRSGWAHEGLLTLELAALCAVAFARPLLDSFGRSPDTFIARGATPRTIVAFGLVVTLAPPLALAVPGLTGRLLGARRRRAVHVVVVAAIAGVATWRLGRDLTDGSWSPPVPVALGVAGGLAVAALRLRTVGARTFLRVAGAASVVYLVQFLALSPTAGLVSGDGAPPLDDELAAQVAAAVGEDPPDVAMLVFDALPTQTLLDGQGRIDPALFPNFAALADTASWYRDDTTVSLFTRDAVPAILTGRYPDPDNRAEDGPAQEPDNLFTLLGGAYDLHVREQITQLCPPDLCPRPRPAGLGRLLADAVELWTGSARAEDDAGGDEFALPSVLDDDRFGEARRWIGEQDFAHPGPDLFFYHAALPHDPWQFLPDGTTYATSRYPIGYRNIGWYGPGIGVAHQRHVLQAQACDRLLGDLLDRLRAAGTLDDTLVVVTADHGHAFVDDEPWRWLSRGNHEELLWTPLLIKAPGQSEGRVVDDNVMSIDVAPTIYDMIGVEPPWRLDGRPIGHGTPRDPDLKLVDDDEDNLWRAEPGESVVTIDGAEASFARVMAGDAVEAVGDDAVWERTVHGGLVGRDVDDLDVQDAGRSGPAREVSVDGLGRLHDIDLDDPLPLEIVGRGDLGDGAHVAYALNGTVSAVAVVEPDERTDKPLVLGLARPDLFVEGRNALTAYLIDGDPGDETLVPLKVIDQR